MAFVDTYRFYARAGTGGDGVVRWRREKFVPKGGPAGGNGGRGGDFFIRAVRDVNRLSKLVRVERFHAEDGVPGGSSSCTGRHGEPYFLELPVGSVITQVETGATHELLREGEEILLLSGGEGGLGNEHFKSSTNQRPMQCTQGKRGEEGTFSVELRLIADVGLIGLPNAGKSSLLNALTDADARVGEYPFTTLEPNLGTYRGYVLADIPGLIEGASAGKGLGHKFLRHVARTKVLVHCISLEQDMLKNVYDLVRNEIETFDGLAEKTEYIVLTKSDVLDADQIDDKVASLEHGLGKRIFATVSILEDASIKEFADKLTQVLHTNP